jgi:hypothetical protein
LKLLPQQRGLIVGVVLSCHFDALKRPVGSRIHKLSVGLDEAR